MTYALSIVQIFKWLKKKKKKKENTIVSQANENILASDLHREKK